MATPSKFKRAAVQVRDVTFPDWENCFEAIYSCCYRPFGNTQWLIEMDKNESSGILLFFFKKVQGDFTEINEKHQYMSLWVQDVSEQREPVDFEVSVDRIWKEWRAPDTRECLVSSTYVHLETKEERKGKLLKEDFLLVETEYFDKDRKTLLYTEVFNRPSTLRLMLSVTPLIDTSPKPPNPWEMWDNLTDS